MAQRNIVRLIIRSQRYTPEVITRKLRVQPTSAWHIGECRQRSKVTEKCNGWVLTSGLTEKVDASKHIGRLRQLLASKLGTIRALARTEDVLFSIVLYEKYCNIGMMLSPEDVLFLSRMRVPLDLDFYALGDGTVRRLPMRKKSARHVS